MGIWEYVASNCPIQRTSQVSDTFIIGASSMLVILRLVMYTFKRPEYHTNTNTCTFTDTILRLVNNNLGCTHLKDQDTILIPTQRYQSNTDTNMFSVKMSKIASDWYRYQYVWCKNVQNCKWLTKEFTAFKVTFYAKVHDFHWTVLVLISIKSF